MTKDHTTPTLEDVARAAGVSTATASRALNSPEKVAPATRERIRAAVQRLGYLPHFGARAMAARRTRTIGAIIPTMENAIFAQGIQSLQETLHAQGYTLLVASSAYSTALEEEQVRALVARGAEALLLIGHDRRDGLLDFLDRHRVPAVAAWCFEPGQRLPSVGFDNRAAMAALARRALALGHRRIGLITAPPAGNDRARARLVGIRDAMAEAGLAQDALHIIETPYGIETGAEAFDRMARLAPRPTLIFCGNDVLAVGALLRARELGMQVPRDVSVTGFDDIDLARAAVPALTTIRVPHREMGHRAAMALISMVETPAAGESVELRTEIRMRKSLAPPGAEHG